MINSGLVALLLALAGTLGSACAADTGESTRAREFAIVNGEVADTSTDGVVKIPKIASRAAAAVQPEAPPSLAAKRS